MAVITAVEDVVAATRAARPVRKVQQPTNLSRKDRGRRNREFLVCHPCLRSAPRQVVEVWHAAVLDAARA